MKGISEVIAIILILMIVIALAALAYTWFSGIFTSLTSGAGQTIQTTTATMSTQFVLEAAACAVGATPTCDTGDEVSMTIRNTGEQPFDATKTTFYIDGILFTDATCSPSTGCNQNSLGKGCTYTCTKNLAAGDPVPKCPATATSYSTMKAVITTGLEASRIINC